MYFNLINELNAPRGASSCNPQHFNRRLGMLASITCWNYGYVILELYVSALDLMKDLSDGAIFIGIISKTSLQVFDNSFSTRVLCKISFAFSTFDFL